MSGWPGKPVVKPEPTSKPPAPAVHVGVGDGVPVTVGVADGEAVGVADTGGDAVGVGVGVPPPHNPVIVTV